MTLRFVNEGTLSVANGATSVVGSGTSWSTTLAHNAIIWIGDEPKPVIVSSRRQRVTDTDPGNEPAGTFIDDDAFQIREPWHGATILASPGETYFALVPESSSDLNEALIRFLADLATFGLIGGAAGAPPTVLPDQYVWVNRTTGVITQRQGAEDIVIGGQAMAIQFIIDGGGAVIATGVKGDLEIPFAGTISAVRMFADQTGSAVVDIWKDTYANYPPTAADKITASAPPTISAALKSQDTILTGWTKAVAAGAILRFNVNSCSSITRLTVTLTILGAQ